MTGSPHTRPVQGTVISADGVRFSIYSENATQVELCLFESDKGPETRRLQMERGADHLWTRWVPDLKPGCLYGFRVFGPYAPEQGHRFNPSKVLADPYGRLLGRRPGWNRRWHSLPPDLEGGSESRTRPDGADNADCAPLCRLVNPEFDWQGDKPPATSWAETILYETHVKGFTRQHPDIPPGLRGTFAGLASEPAIAHLKSLGVTAVELLPIHQGAEEQRLVQSQLTNYWNYNTLLFFAPDLRLAATGDPIREFREMVRSLHEAGLEVILDVVYNHTVEGDARGPTLCFRGIDNRTYYRLDPENPALYENITGCGNTMNFSHAQVRQLALDSLRYWVTDMHVDGFRFDLGAVLGRDENGFSTDAAFFQAVQADPVLSRVKLIAEPWDLGHEGYQVAGFPDGWSEWNDQYRQTVRRFWLGAPDHVGLMARRLSGSGDFYQPQNRSPRSSVNYITCHDGFTLQDLVSYQRKHNEANGEHNRDGNNDNASCNHGIEGATRKPEILKRRTRHMKNLMATLLLSLGTPMISGGDELRRTQRGNNNAYCQDNSTSWYDWHLDHGRQEFLEFIRKLIHLRKSSPIFQRDRFLTGETDPESGLKDVTWLKPDGTEMEETDWHDPEALTLACLLTCPDVNQTLLARGSILLLLNAGLEECPWILPSLPPAGNWEVLLDTETIENRLQTLHPADSLYPLAAHTLAVLQWN
ncbi:glycogen debranching protein GlgX [Nitrospina sp. 32_T5]|uniref:glycogen debranching protein GlgX n=1 Tax=unclassified Nitrospina TaxID=2638683 RepID=UPI003F99A81C